MKRLLLVLILLAPLGAFALSSEELADARDAVVLVAEDGGFGSGVVISPNGFILTNYHVIHGATEEKLFIWFYDEADLNYYRTRIIGIDPLADLALLQVLMPQDRLPLTYLDLEDEEDNIKMGNVVYAIGHPVGLQWTVSQGIINHENRASFINGYIRLLQHTAQIQKGNSGGALINEDGKLVGINTYILQPPGKEGPLYTGFGYATRGDIINFSIIKMLEDGLVVRPALGIIAFNFQEFTRRGIVAAWEDPANPFLEAPAAPVKLPDIFGVIVLKTEETEWAVSQGLKEYDIIVSINGDPVNHLSDLHRIIREMDIGEVITLMINREGMFQLLDYELTTLEFDYMEYYNERNTQRAPQPDVTPTPEPEEDTKVLPHHQSEK